MFVKALLRHLQKQGAMHSEEHCFKMWNKFLRGKCLKKKQGIKRLKVGQDCTLKTNWFREAWAFVENTLLCQMQAIRLNSKSWTVKEIIRNHN